MRTAHVGPLPLSPSAELNRTITICERHRRDNVSKLMHTQTGLGPSRSTLRLYVHRAQIFAAGCGKPPATPRTNATQRNHPSLSKRSSMFAHHRTRNSTATTLLASRSRALGKPTIGICPGTLFAALDIASALESGDYGYIDPWGIPMRMPDGKRRSGEETLVQEI